MKTLVLLITFTFFSLQLLAQPVDARGQYAYADIENVEMGWMSPLKFTEPAKPFAKNGWNYTAKQTEITRKIGAWIQETYTPTGLLGELKLSLLATEPSKYKGTNSYDLNEVEKDALLALPNTYGAWAKFHKCVVKTKEHKFWPMYGNLCDVQLTIMANNLHGISLQVMALNSATDYYFTLPKYTIGEKGRHDNDWMPVLANYRNFTNSPNLKKYEHYFYPVARAHAYVIIMTKDGKPLPIEQVTFGEFFKRLEEQYPLLLQMAKNRNLISENYQENSKKRHAGVERQIQKFIE